VNDMTEPDEAQDLSDGLARVVRAPTMIKHLEEVCRRARQHGGSAFPPAVCWIRLDEADDHRDQLGFSGLEKLMHAVHERARVQLNEGDVTARFGLAAIGVILESQGGDRDHRRDADAILRAINNSLFELGDHSIAATVSIAIATVRESLRPAEANLVAVARQAEKLSERGGNRADVGRGAPDEDGGSPGSLLGQLTKALRDNNVKVVFQPLLATSGPEHERLQLLPRLSGTDGQLIPAARFVPIAAERGVLPALDQWMIGHALKLIRQRAQSGSEVPTMFLNQSPALIEDEKFFEWLHDQIDDVEMGLRNLVLEFSILELKPRLRNARDVLAKLRKMGIGVGLTGIDETVPEVVLLKHLPADFLRMKADFARRMLADESLAEGFQRFAADARDAGRSLIVPMLEDAEEVSRIWQMDVDLIQGNFIQQPSEVPLEA
jgi:EAL domain-containing protein (putative c-di-GMP-specific phosphodiesterase class I)/GGDEF domain-containing protein